MGSVGFPSLLVQGMAASTTRPPELLAGPEYAAYAQEVLGEPSGRTEEDVDVSLAAKASDLGIDVAALDPRPSPTASPKPSTVESSAAVATRCERTNSTASNVTTSTDLTSQNSISLPATLTEAAPKLVRRRSKALNFSQYDKYLSQVDPTLNQPKFLPQYPTKPDRPGSVFSMASKISVRDFKRGIAMKLRRKKKPAHRSASVM